MARLPQALCLVLMGLVGACALPTQGPRRASTSAPAVNVVARGETVPVGSVNQDAADDPAIWRNASDPASSLIVGTDKKAGLYVYDLSGQIRDFINSGHVNNVDLRTYKGRDGTSRVIVAASDRNDLANAKIALFELETPNAKLRPLGVVPAGAGEAYGICLYGSDSDLFAFVVMKDGTINQVKLDLNKTAVSGQIVRRLKLGTQSEGCVVDDVVGRLYVAEEDVGLWRFEAGVDQSSAPTKIASANGRELVADVEGVALADDPQLGRLIIVSSQGDNAYSIYAAHDDGFVGRFRIGSNGVGSSIGATEETDGIDILVGDFGARYPGGLFVAQDGINPSGAQNFKLVSWNDIKAALGLDRQ